MKNSIKEFTLDQNFINTTLVREFCLPLLKKIKAHNSTALTTEATTNIYDDDFTTDAVVELDSVTFTNIQQTSMVPISSEFTKKVDNIAYTMDVVDTQESITLDFGTTIIENMVVILPSFDLDQGEILTEFIQVDLDEKGPIGNGFQFTNAQFRHSQRPETCRNHAAQSKIA